MPVKACCATTPVAQETIMRRRKSGHRHPDLFAPEESPPVPIVVADRTKLLPLVSTLLTEALAPVARAEASDEDHA
jgi:hypothetical protein